MLFHALPGAWGGRCKASRKQRRLLSFTCVCGPASFTPGKFLRITSRKQHVDKEHGVSLGQFNHRRVGLLSKVNHPSPAHSRFEIPAPNVSNEVKFK